MSEQKHTPGPWAISRYPVSEDIYYHAIFAKAADDGRTVTVATITPISDDGQAGGESHHNARLIAAAPELLDALKEARSMLETARGYFPKSIHNSDRFSLLNVLENAVKPAIAKAETLPELAEALKSVANCDVIVSK